MVVLAPLVQAEQDGSIGVRELREVTVVRRGLRLAEKALVPVETGSHVGDGDDRPCALHPVILPPPSPPSVDRRCAADPNAPAGVFSWPDESRGEPGARSAGRAGPCAA